MQKRLFDEVILTIENQISMEESAQALEIQLEVLAKEEETLKSHLEGLKEVAEELAESQRRLEFLSIGLDPSKTTVEA
jgi:cell division protein FtsB